MTTDLSQRLRFLRSANNWSVTDMAARTGIPKRTLDKYMLRSGASLPGFDALCSLSKGLGVSLDYLVFGGEFGGEGYSLITERAATEVIEQLIETILSYAEQGRADLIADGRVLGVAPEEWANTVGSRAGEIAKRLVAEGVTKEAVLLWLERRKDRIIELAVERYEKMTQPATGN